MGRPREFDEATAVAAAAEVFRSRGFHATSVDDLVRSTGVNRSSLYGAFGSKHGLFLRVLDHVGRADADPATRLDLCLVALLDLAPSDDHVRDRAADILRRAHLTPVDLAERLLARAGLPTPPRRSPS